MGRWESDSPFSLIADRFSEEPGASFQQPLADPGVDPTADPLVCIRLNRAWKSYLAGAATQLLMPASWEYADDAALTTIMDRALLVLEAIAFAELCPMPGISDLKYDCPTGLQYSKDGGTTWAEVPGWLANFCACVVACARGGNVGVLVMQPGVSSPPAPVWTPDGTDWVYAP